MRPRKVNTSDSHESCDCPNNTWAYIWKTTTDGNIGHASIQQGGCTPKASESDSGRYLSLWPKFPAIGPLSVLPIRAKLETTLNGDMEHEAEQNRVVAMNHLEEGGITHSPLKMHTPPDEIFLIKNLNQNAIEEKVSTVKEDVSQGRLLYQLFPAVDALAFLHAVPSHLSQDPTDIALFNKNQGNMKSPKVNNCTTLVGEILNSGGMSIRQSRNPMGLTPASLSEQIENDPRSTRIKLE